MILAFLEPDFVAIAGNLRACGLTAEQIDEVMTESYPPARSPPASGRRRTRRSGTSSASASFDDPATAEAFEIAG